jgi:NAD(P)-dependent dehydrogenase (short-subunit alcohol dehydrogenase family)
MSGTSGQAGAPVALITGGARGIGRAIAAELAGRGYRLSLLARDVEPLRQMHQANPAGVLLSAVDVTDVDALQKTLEATLQAFGRLDVVVHNAGYAPVLTIEQTTPQQWQRIVDTNLSAAVHLARLAWPVFTRQKSGVIVNLSSLAARDPFPGLGAYGAAKAALHVLGLALAREGQAIGVRVHTIAPGSVETTMFRKLMTVEQWPSEKTLSPEEVAKVVGQCVGGELRHTSGEVIYIHKTAP